MERTRRRDMARWAARWGTNFLYHQRGLGRPMGCRGGRVRCTTHYYNNIMFDCIILICAVCRRPRRSWLSSRIYPHSPLEKLRRTRRRYYYLQFLYIIGQAYAETSFSWELCDAPSYYYNNLRVVHIRGSYYHVCT